MADESGQERTEQPSEKRLREAAEKGQVPRSRELSAAATLAACAITLLLFGGVMARAFGAWLADALVVDPALLEQPGQLPQAFGLRTLHAFVIAGPLFIAALVGALFAGLSMGGWNFSPQALTPDFSKLDPVAGFGRLFSLNSLAELAKSLLKVGGIGLCVWVALKTLAPSLASLAAEPGVTGLAHAASLARWMLIMLSGTLVVIAAVDVPYQWFRHRHSLMMTRQELLDEMKESDGRPEVKGRIRRLQAESARRRMMDAVPKADVIVTNPTHYAVALKYASGSQRAPVVVAKGADYVAAAIRELGDKHSVPRVEAPPLARALYRSVDIGREIPVNLYPAVAQVLTYVYQLRNWRTRGGRYPNPPQVDVPASLDPKDPN